MGRSRRVESGCPVEVDALTRRVAALEAEVAALRAERELLQRLPVLTVSVDFDGRPITLGGPWTALLGFSVEELRSMHFIETIHIDDRALVEAEANRLAAPGAARGGFRARMRRKEGGFRWFQIESATDPVRQIHYCVAHDVHELVEAVDLLDRTGAMARVGGWELDLTTREFRLSAEISRIHELEPGTTLDVTRGIEFYPPEAQPTINAVFAAGELEGKPWDVVVPFVTARGRRIWVRVQGLPVWEAGRVARIHGLFQDVSAQHEAEESFIHLFDITPVPLMIMDGFEPVRVNRRMVHELGWDPMGVGGAEGMLAAAFPDPEYRERVMAAWTEHVALADRGIVGAPLEVWVAHGDGSRGLYDVRGGVVGGRRVVSLHEIGERRALIAELEAHGAALHRIHEITGAHHLDFAAKGERLLELIVETFRLEFGLVARVDG
ncbi:MAG TPA: PAS domain-containing protein, partial [Nannocystaceae bacterium]|nr:PAS domain-containing protein [Nannocystaceae bacterium]